MLGVSSLLDFLLGLISDEDAKAEFERDPQGTLRANGFDDLCGEDVYDMAPVLGDHSGVRFIGGGGGGGGGGGADAIHAIRYIQKSYVAKPDVHNYYNYQNFEYSQTIDQRIIVDGDGNTIIVDSYNTKNVGVENHGTITDSAIVGGDGTAVNNSGNEDNDDILSHNDVGSNNDVGSDNEVASDNFSDNGGGEPEYASTLADSSSDSSTESYDEVAIESFDEEPPIDESAG